MDFAGDQILGGHGPDFMHESLIETVNIPLFSAAIVTLHALHACSPCVVGRFSCARAAGKDLQCDRGVGAERPTFGLQTASGSSIEAAVSPVAAWM